MADFEKVTYTPVYYGEDMPDRPHPYAKFSYKFLGWEDDKGGFYPAPDYRYPNEVLDFPETVTGDMTFTAQWALVNPNMEFPDKIPSESHFDKWWGDYGIICFAASSTKDDKYTVMFADWYFNVYRYCTIGYGTQGKMSYEIRFNGNSIELYQITGNGDKEIKNKDISYDNSMTCIRDGMYFTKEKNHDYGSDFGMSGELQGSTFVNPFGSGAKLAWLY
jgi:hypothetical protein